LWGAVLAVAVLLVLQATTLIASPWIALAAWLGYPPAGYLLGMLCAAERSLRSG
jgi:hypothetical protein